MEDFKLMYDNFNKAIAGGKMDEAVAMRSEPARKSFEEYIKTPEDKASTLKMLQAMIPVSYTTDYLDQKEAKASLYLTANFKDPQNAEKTVCQELEVSFAKEGADWKLNDLHYMADPTKLKKSPDDNFEPKENYDLDSNTSMGGRIRSVKFEKDYTLVKIMMLDEEDLAYLPNKEELEKTGLKIADLVPYKIISVSGHKHNTNPMKVWGNTAEIIETE